MQFYRLVIKVLKENFPHSLLVHLLVTIILDSIVGPYILTHKNQYVINNDPTQIITWLIYAIVVNALSRLYHHYFTQPSVQRLSSGVHKSLEEFYLKVIQEKNFEDLENLIEKEQIYEVINKTKWSALGFIITGINNTINILPIFGYIGYLLWIQPMLALLYIIVLITSIWYFVPKEFDVQPYFDIWKEYTFVKNTFVRETTHFNGDKVSQKLGSLMEKKESLQHKDNQNDRAYTLKINLMLDAAIFVYLFFFFQGVDAIDLVIIVCQYIILLRTYTSMCCDYYNYFREASKEFKQFCEKVSQCTNRKYIPHVNDFEKITVQYLTYQYPEGQKKSDEEGIDVPCPTFGISLGADVKIQLCKGQTVLLNGDSGHGKSTFVKLLAGLMGHEQYQHQILIDDEMCKYGFNILNKCRFYVKQNERADKNFSAYEIITGELLDTHENNSHGEHEETVWEALTMAGCADFITLSKTEKNKKNVYQRKINPSGGQEGRLVIAHALWKIMFSWKLHGVKPSLIILDEADKSVQPKLAKQIMQNIMDYCHEQNILLVMVAHTTEVHELKYDLVINFRDGLLSVEK